ncbi:unnamed protein product [Musa acuminata subsp. burmannicoides]
MMRRGRGLGTLYFNYTLPFAEREKAEGGLAVAGTLSTDAGGQNSNHGVIRTQSLVYASHSFSSFSLWSYLSSSSSSSVSFGRHLVIPVSDRHLRRQEIPVNSTCPLSSRS